MDKFQKKKNGKTKNGSKCFLLTWISFSSFFFFFGDRWRELGFGVPIRFRSLGVCNAPLLGPQVGWRWLKKTQRTPNVYLKVPPALQIPPTNPRKDARRGNNVAQFRASEGKKGEFWLPTLRAPTLLGPHLFLPPPFHPRQLNTHKKNLNN